MFKNLGALYCDLKNHGETGERDLPEGVQHVKDLTVKHKSIEKKWQYRLFIRIFISRFLVSFPLQDSSHFKLREQIKVTIKNKNIV